MSMQRRRSSIKSPTRGQLGERLLGKAEEVEEMSSAEPRKAAMWAVLPERWAQLLDNNALKQAQAEKMKEEKEQAEEADAIREQMHRMPRTSHLLKNFYRDNLMSAAVEEKDNMDDLTEESIRQEQEDRVLTQKQRVSSMHSDLEYMQRVLHQTCGDAIVETEPEAEEEPEEEVMQYVQAKPRGSFAVN
ncbi:hypothetical protein CYMTET_21967 [Cymbomonas tetramitiformis]|uniref:Uncharacterized protein n=1 Tax=Cymbomonas tetramitiformis TaxID=36881 RepID=A0AAE0L2G4_9CHLO|nr:hypothetical protein CYMTET_21967 [Cymbomonas tetramitiformis]